MEKSLAERVDALVLDSMYRGPHEATEDVIRKEGVKVECVVHTFFFHPERVRANKDAIAAVIASRTIRTTATAPTVPCGKKASCSPSLPTT